MKVLGLIPARGGSVRIPNKNLEELGGRSLIARAIDIAMASDAVVVAVSTDSARIAAIAGAHGAEVVDRPAELSRGDQLHQMSVVRHALGLLTGFDAVMLLQPTSPFRTKDDIAACVEALDRYDAVVSITEPELYSVFENAGGHLFPPGRWVAIPNGAIYAMKTQAVADGRHWYDGRVFGYWMPRERSIDIDTREQLELARSMVDHA